MLTKRCAVPIGTFDETSFQTSLCGDGSSGIGLPLFEGLGVLCLPSIGVYGNDFFPYPPRAVVRVPISIPALSSCGVPEELLRDTFGRCSPPNDSLLCAVVVHSFPPLAPCQHIRCSSEREINLIQHTWVLQDAQYGLLGLDTQVDVSVGLFVPWNVSEVHQRVDDISELKMRGVPFGRLEPRWVTAHGGRLSPCNCHISLDSGDAVRGHSFFTVSQCSSRGVAVVFHVIPCSNEEDVLLQHSIARCLTVSDLVAALGAHFGKEISGVVECLVTTTAKDDCSAEATAC